MNLTSLLKNETILLPLDAGSRDECIEKMVDSLVGAGFVTDAKSYVDAVLTRETTGSTGIGFGVAIPHGKSKGVAAPGLAFARLSNSVDWNAMDGKPVSMVFLIAVPEEQAGNEHLKILVALSRKLIHQDFRDQLTAAQTPQDIFTILETL
ncbi:MAG: PTS sugar transporter subunit IIA [Tumebacillaceae bacterium]